MVLELDLYLIKKVGLNAAILFSYLEFKKDNIKTDGFCDVKLKEIQKELGLKRYALKAAICQLENDKLVKSQSIKKGIISNVRFQFLYVSICKHRALNTSNPGADNCIPTRFLGADFCTSMEKPGADFCDGKQKREAASIYTSNNINIITLKKNKFDNVIQISDVRNKIKKNALFCLDENIGTSSKLETLPLLKKAVLLPTKPKVNNNTSTSLLKREKDVIMAQEVLEYLNQKTGKKFNINASSNLNNILSLISEGYEFLDFIKVIDKKYDEWNGIIMYGKPGINFLRPFTLFNPEKFDTYLNEESKSAGKNFKDDLDRDLYNFFIKSGCQPC